MGETNCLFFWMGGLITPPLPNLLAGALAEMGKTRLNPYRFQSFQQHSEDLILGRLDGTAFCQALCDWALPGCSGVDLENRILAQAIVDDRILELIQGLPVRYARWVIVDLPSPWFLALTDRKKIIDCFSDEKVLLLSEAGLPHVMPDLLDTLADRARQPMSRCLLLAQNAHRTIQALNYGMPAAVITDASRLKRELILRNMIVQFDPMDRWSLSL